MKIAIPILGSRVSPRFDFSPEVWIIDVERGEVVGQEKLPTAHLNLSQRLEQIASNGVDQVICGGIDGFCQNQLESGGIDIVQDVMGDAEIVFDRFMEGRLQPGLYCEGKGRRRFCGRRNASRGRRI
jgi:predicted Fe-Mo cluster-binding NifX family protein